MQVTEKTCSEEAPREMGVYSRAGRGVTGFIQKKSVKISLPVQYSDGDHVYIIV